MRRIIGLLICMFIFSASCAINCAAENEKLDVDIKTYDGRSVIIKDERQFCTPLPVTFTPQAADCSYSISTDDGETFSTYIKMDKESVTLFPDDDTSPSGRWQIRFREGDDGKESDIYRIVFDVNPPEIVFTDPEKIDGWLTGSVRVHFAISDENALARIVAKCGDTVLYEMHRSEDDKMTACSVELELGDMGRARSTVDIACYDIAGNRMDMSFEYLFDESVPVIYAEGILSGECYSGKASLKAIAKDRDSEAYVCYTLERRTNKELTETEVTGAPADTVIAFEEEGRYKIRIWAEDSAGNRSAELTKSFTVDGSAPVIQLTGVTENVDVRTNAVISVDVSDGIYEGTKVDIKLSKTDHEKTEIIPIESYTLLAEHDIREVNINSDGDYLLEVTAKDPAGNTVKEYRHFRMDATAPDISISGIDEGDITNGKPVLRFSAGEMFYASTVMSAILERKEGSSYSVAESLDRVMRSANDHIDIEAEKEGEYRLTCIAADRSGNTSSSRLSFTVDRTPPVISDLKDIDSKYFKSFSLPAKLSSLIKDASGFTADAYIDDRKIGENDVIIEEGKYVLTILAEDGAQNTSEASASFIVDHTSPQIVLGGFDRDGNIRRGGTIKVSLAEDCDRLVSVKFNDRNIAVSSDNTATISVDGYGQYCLAVKAEDPAGNVTDTQIHTSSPMYAGIFGEYMMTEKSIEAALPENDENEIDYVGILIGLCSVLSGTFGLAFRTFLHH
ncbi:MAG: hypothetical protein K6F73_06305 [Lachnospiraceae bacterium]|nr:hypothetical protein [Lachnospiraceae bacterium]